MPADYDHLLRLAARRHSCRAFTGRVVPRVEIERMLTLAQHAASWCNTQPWQVAVTSGPTTTALADRLTAAALAGERRSDLPRPAAYTGIYRDRRREAGHGLYAGLGIDRADGEARTRQALENFRFFGAPHTAIVTTDRDLGTYGAVDCGAYVAALLLAAESLGLGAIAQAAIATVSDAVREFLELPESRLVVCAVSFGYADEEHPANRFRVGRAALDQVVTWV
ncbi:nitroreductase family protein [Nocardioides sp. BP30]|uniref:nitroreductase family protein n=1 Tax=Nocardioides sp. BP30 TaxID=3036374 RepID=UPI0024690B98|nr:nitroreductase family protein [Nocardioides sp. BP30]WGL54096.1 nitroreductase family protein [Nocardioides sp. BP30]